MTSRTARIFISLILLLFIIAPIFAESTGKTTSPVAVKLNGTRITADNPGVLVNGSTLTIILPGDYSLKGTLTDGQIIVDCPQAVKDGIKTTNEENEWGYISMEGGAVSITCGDDPLVVMNALNITGGTINAVIDPSLNTTD